MLNPLPRLLACAAAAAALALPCLAEPENEPGTSLSTLELDTTFGSGGAIRPPAGAHREIGGFTKVRVDSKGRLLSAVTTRDAKERGYVSVSRFRPDGTLDRSFGKRGVATFRFGEDPAISGIVVDGRDRVVIAGRFPGPRRKQGERVWCALRLTERGAPDRSFSGDGRVEVPRDARLGWGEPRLAPGDGIAILAVKVLDDAYGIIRLDGRGRTSGESAEPLGFVDIGQIDFRDYVIDAQGRAVVATSDRVFRVGSDGVQDANFGVQGALVGPDGGRVGVDTGCLALDAQGRIALRGREPGDVTPSLYRFLEDGALDPAFSGDGRAVWLSAAPAGVQLLRTELAVAGDAQGRWVFATEFLTPEDAPDGAVVQSIDPAAPGAVAAFVIRRTVPLGRTFRPAGDLALAGDGSAAFINGVESVEQPDGTFMREGRLRRVDLTPRDPVLLPDLQLAWEEEPVVTGTAAPFSFSAVLRVSNAGPGFVTQAHVRFVLSQDAVFDLQDQALGTWVTGFIGAGGAVVLPVDTGPVAGAADPSGRRILAIVNHDGLQMETDLTNDLLVSAPLE